MIDLKTARSGLPAAAHSTNQPKGQAQAGIPEQSAKATAQRAAADGTPATMDYQQGFASGV